MNLCRSMFRYEREAVKKGFEIIAGVDEAGRGPLAGPVVAGAVVLSYDLRCRSNKSLRKNLFIPRFTERIDDSKKLTPMKRERAYREIVEKAIIGVGIVDVDKIDKINIFRASALAMQKAISNLKIRPDYILVDGKMNLQIQNNWIGIIRGDAKSFTIAAASIVAKVIRDKIMVYYDKIYPQYGFARHKGYPTQEHLGILRKNGPSPIHRRSFRPVYEQEHLISTQINTDAKKDSHRYNPEKSVFI